MFGGSIKSTGWPLVNEIEQNSSQVTSTDHVILGYLKSFCQNKNRRIRMSKRGIIVRK